MLYAFILLLQVLVICLIVSNFVGFAIGSQNLQNKLFFSCRNMVDCSQRVALVLGGAGNVGSGVVGGFLRRGYGKVAVVSRDPVRMDNLRKLVGAASDRLVCILGDVGTEAGAEAARQEVSESLHILYEKSKSQTVC